MHHPCTHTVPVDSLSNSSCFLMHVDQQPAHHTAAIQHTSLANTTAQPNRLRQAFDNNNNSHNYKPATTHVHKLQPNSQHAAKSQHAHASAPGCRPPLSTLLLRFCNSKSHPPTQPTTLTQQTPSAPPNACINHATTQPQIQSSSSMIAFVYSLHVALPPRSPVLCLPSAATQQHSKHTARAHITQHSVESE